MRGGPRRARRGNTSASSLVRTERDDEQVIWHGEFAVTHGGGSKLGGQGENRTHLEKLSGFTVRRSPTERPAQVVTTAGHSPASGGPDPITVILRSARCGQVVGDDTLLYYAKLGRDSKLRSFTNPLIR